jgi:hypothetical protein
MTNDDFYAECAALLNCKHEGEAFPYHKRTRWNNRSAGRGRFPNHGLIRVFGDTVQVNLVQPYLCFIGSKEEVLDRLKKLC